MENIEKMLYEKSKITETYQTPKEEKPIYRGDIYMADVSFDITGSEQSGFISFDFKSIIFIPNNKGNKYAPTVTVVMLSSKTDRHKLPTHVYLNNHKGGLQKDTIVLCEQLRTINKSRLTKKVGSLDDFMMNLINRRLRISLGI